MALFSSRVSSAAVFPSEGTKTVSYTHLAWEGLICMQEIGKCTEEHQEIVRKWLEERKLEEVRTSELFDAWWD